MIGRQSTTSSINLCIAIDHSQPRDKVFDDPLVQLVKDVRSDRLVDIQKWQIFPERMLHRFDSSFSACLCEGCGALTYCVERFEDFRKLAWRSNTSGITQFIVVDRTCWTLACLDCGNEKLFWIITNKRGIDWVATPNDTISTCHMNAVNTSCFQRFEDVLHTGME